MTGTAPMPLPLSAPVNLRDLGGIPVDGGVLRAGFALRADDLAIVTEEVAGDLVDGGLRAVIDLRSADEVGMTGRGPLGAQVAVSYHHVPLIVGIGPSDEGDPLDQTSYAPMYVRMYEGSAPQIVTALAIIAYAPGAVAFHCAAGQDRTGVLAAALLLALGADVDDIVSDYTRTGESSAAIMARISPMMAPLMARFGLDLEEAARAALGREFSPAPMRDLLGTLTERYVDPLTPLRAAGLSDDLVARLRERAMTPTSAT
ncbi:tyrosine-protein phosphatase [Promicromonospora sp. Populi]|uniref:tyrosine-protein phosphatase n=1 Tax=Promicromonospora sp. Populi TaxID=3239420 RepID=UPI0034E22FB2